MLISEKKFAGRGCAAAALRLWLLPDSDLPPIEMCGEKALNEHWQYITQGQSARISFTSADKAIGAQVSKKQILIYAERRVKNILSRASVSCGLKFRTLAPGRRQLSRYCASPLTIISVSFPAIAYPSG